MSLHHREVQWLFAGFDRGRWLARVLPGVTWMAVWLAGCDGDTLNDFTSDGPGQVPSRDNRAPRIALSVMPHAAMAPVKARIVVTCSDADGDSLRYRVGYVPEVWDLSHSQPIHTTRSFTAPVTIRAECEDENGAISNATHALLVINAPVQGDSILALTNAARSQNGVGALSLDASLNQIAQSHARDMADRNYYGHATPEGITFVQRLQRAGIAYSAAGENIARDSSAAAVVRTWMTSEDDLGHMLNASFRRLGVGAYRTLTSPYTYFVQVFTN